MVDKFSITKGSSVTKLSISKDLSATPVTLTKNPGSTRAYLTKNPGGTKVRIVKYPVMGGGDNPYAPITTEGQVLYSPADDGALSPLRGDCVTSVITNAQFFSETGERNPFAGEDWATHVCKVHQESATHSLQRVNFTLGASVDLSDLATSDNLLSLGIHLPTNIWSAANHPVYGDNDITMNSSKFQITSDNFATLDQMVGRGLSGKSVPGNAVWGCSRATANPQTATLTAINNFRFEYVWSTFGTPSAWDTENRTLYVFGIWTQPEHTAAICITQDDGAKSADVASFISTLDTYGLVGNIAQVGTSIGATGPTIAALQGYYATGHDITVHGSSYIDTHSESTSAFITDYAVCRDILLANGMPRGANHLVYGGGQNGSELVIALLNEGYVSARVTGSSIDTAINLTSPKSSRLFNPMAHCALNQVTGDADGMCGFQATIDHCIAHGRTAHIYGHTFSDVGGSPTDWSTTEFDTLCDYIKTKKDLGQITDVTQSELHNYHKSGRL